MWVFCVLKPYFRLFNISTDVVREDIMYIRFIQTHNVYIYYKTTQHVFNTHAIFAFQHKSRHKHTSARMHIAITS